MKVGDQKLKVTSLCSVFKRAFFKEKIAIHTLTLRARLGKITSLALYVLSLWTLACSPSSDLFLRR